MRLLPLACLTLFALVDLAANWHASGMVSVSEQVWELENRFGWWAYVALAAIVGPLVAHLFLRFPYGP